MTETSVSESGEQPVWARDDAFPRAPEGWGWQDPKGGRHACGSEAELLETIRDDRAGIVFLVWSPRHPHMVVPEEIEGATSELLIARKRRAADDFAESLDRVRWFGFLLAGVTLWMLYQGWAYAPRAADAAERIGFAFRAVLISGSIGISLLMFLIFAFIPWYQSRKRLKELVRWDAGDIAEAVPILRFETWLDYQKAPVTMLMLGIISVVGLVQFLPGSSIEAAGLVKERYPGAGEWWRLLTAPLLHGNPVHFALNAAALYYLGKRVEVFARWPHVVVVFLFSAWVGGEASARFLAAPSVGASGGLMGWLGFLLVFESLHARLVPRRSRRRLLAGVLLTAVIGAIGFRFIDNAAHAGGLLAGMAYGALVFPKSSSAMRPRATITDLVAGAAAMLVLLASAVWAVFVIASGR